MEKDKKEHPVFISSPEDNFATHCKVFATKMRIGEVLLFSNVDEFSHQNGTYFHWLRVIHTPGHTVDHAAFWLEEEQALFTGDCVLGEGTTVLEKLSDYMRSLNKLLAFNATILYPGHGPVVTDSKKHITNYIEHRNQREKQILACLQELNTGHFMSSEQILNIVYKGIASGLIPAALRNINNHLEKLQEERAVEMNSAGRWRALVPGGKL